MRNEKNIFRHELIGLRVEIRKAKNKSYNKIKGTIIDETKNSIILEKDGKRRNILKKGTIFLIHLNGKRIEMAGDMLLGRPEDRIKNKLKKW
ncbi:MAG: ribonuclease P protein subunit [Candidatus Aenigmatarchaeota archaeon]|nr:MAG: ribonuclease P protein subunit [Candidatus Aenigmarchaeota archaeon]